MNTEEIFKRYTEAGNKSRAVKEMADEYGVAGSDIVCELFKTGYKFEELKRASVTQYKSAQKKYQQWKNNGSQPDQEEDVMEKYKNEEGEFTVNSPEDMVQLLSADNEKLIKENEELKKIKGELEKRINSLKVSDFNSTVDSFHGLNTDISTAKASLFLAGSWNGSKGESFFERECLLEEQPVFRCIEAAIEDDKKNNCKCRRNKK